MRRIVCAALLLASLPSAAEWAPLGKSAQLTLYIDKATISPRGKYTKAWLLWDAAEAIPVEGKDTLSSTELRLFDCQERTFGSQQQVWYKEPMAQGAVIETIATKLSQVQFNDAGPNTLNDRVMREVCKPASKPSR